MAKQKRDFVELGRAIVEQAIGEKMDGSPLENLVDLRNQNAVALGRLGGHKGGKSRAEKLTPAQRKRIAQKAAQARWSGKSST